MHADDLSRWTPPHDFHDVNRAGERGTRRVLWITLATMVVEIGAGLAFNSMALLADGWHMGSHAVAIGMAVLAYAAVRRYADDPRFAFGTWKIEVLGGYTSALLLVGVAALMLAGSLERLLSPRPIHYPQAMAVAALGLGVNLACALILGKAHAHHDHGHGHQHDHGHGHGHGDAHPDLNLRSAYVHVIADAATSVLALLALAGGWWAGWAWLDPAMGVVGAVLILAWARGLLRDTGKVLLDREMDAPVVAEIREAVETGPEAGDTRLADLHVWRVGRLAYACAMALVTHDPALTPQRVREALSVHGEIVHSTIEIHLCPDDHGAPPRPAA